MVSGDSAKFDYDRTLAQTVPQFHDAPEVSVYHPSDFALAANG